MNSENLLNALEFFIYGLAELSILFIAISFFVEIINLKMNPDTIKKVLSTKKNGYLSAAVLGAVTPFCSCSTIPLTVGLLKARAGFGAVMTFLFTSPILNPIIIFVFYVSFGLKITVFYTFVAFGVSLFAGFLLEKFGFEKYVKEDVVAPACELKKFSPSPKVATSSSFSTNAPMENESCCEKEVKQKSIYKELFIQTYKQFLAFLPYIALGIGIGAFIHGFVPKEFITKYAGSDSPFAVIISSLIGIPMYIRAETMIGLAPELIDKGVNLGSILALTIAGAGASLPEMIMLKKIFKAPIIIFFLITVFGMAIGSGYIVNLYFV